MISVTVLLLLCIGHGCFASSREGVLVKEGDRCAVGNEQGLWTYGDGDCGANGCCKLPSISMQKCRQFAQRRSDGKCHGSTSSFMANLFDEDANTLDGCSGILVSVRFVLTNGLCLLARRPRMARIGGKNATPLIWIIERILHPNYTLHVTGLDTADFGLLKLEAPVTVTADIRPVCLAPSDAIADDQLTLMAFVWNTGTLVRRTMSPMDASECGRYAPNYDDGQHFCAQRADRIPCELKTGSALVVPADDDTCTTLVVGLKSIDHDCDRVSFARIYPVVGWIEGIVWPIRATSSRRTANRLSDVIMN